MVMLVVMLMVVVHVCSDGDVGGGGICGIVVCQ